ncbi:acyltransferase family protein [Spiribacter vilamensis]|uniref:Peptidoglycan/LPS O-acetylase OafA/YrhL n=1 Tax=Spiribacter vilamensis TaxID=531306 RepID=A0A4Q8D144_9GAMM|nr:acyltransferase family protein [Spiribacter vilamensis]RZU99076.1 peptidoglycan/LPS O-acetylase OafA/YrhL [Spiribacter vilamensis]
MQYRPEIDGLRAIAVLPVILFHADLSLLSGGFVGVDIFFVISGYLITTIIYQEMVQGRFSMWRFYERRARRILPALFVVSLACIPFAWLWMVPNEFKDFSQSLVGVATFTSNILFWRESGYFAAAAELKPLLHTWSLAVEEQFYILYPPLLLALYRFLPKALFLIISSGALISLGLAHWASSAHPSANFYLLPSRGWELGIGALVAIHLHRRRAAAASQEEVGFNSGAPFSRSIREIAGIIGLGLIAYAIFAFDETTPFPSLWTLIPVIGVALIILAADRDTLIGRLLGLRVLVGVGLISYSAYLWHQPLFAFARIRLFEGVPDGVYWALIVATFVLAYLTWLAVEVPARKRLKLPRPKILSGAVAGLLAVGIVGGMGWIKGGLPDRNAPSGLSFSQIDASEMTEVNHGLSSTCEGSFTLSPECRTGENPSVMVWGDSYAMHLMQALTSSQASETVDFIQFTKSVCAPIFDLAITDQKRGRAWSEGCIEFNSQVNKWLQENSSVEYVIMSSPMGIISSNTYDDSGNLHPTSDSKSIVMEKLNETADYIRSVGKTPVFVAPPPRTGDNLARCVIGNLVFGSGEGSENSCSFSQGEVSSGHQRVTQFLHSSELDMAVVDLSDYLCNQSGCKAAVGKTNIFRDSGHLSHAGSALVGRESNLLGAVMAAADSYAVNEETTH